jgi:chromate reductase, NAD(P)H dehydrogenase (quinone)
MSHVPKILAFAGSARVDSLNKRLARVAAGAARAAGGEVTLIDLDDYPMPVYHGDLEAREGVPGKARELRELFRANDALLIASPENNASVSSLLKNTLDWLSRPSDGQNGLVPYQGKVAALLAASPGALGGMRGLAHLRQILQTLNVLVLPEQFALPRAHEAFDGSGALADPKQQAVVTGIARRLVDVTARLAAR